MNRSPPPTLPKVRIGHFFSIARSITPPEQLGLGAIEHLISRNIPNITIFTPAGRVLPRRGESRPAALKIKMKALFAHCHSQLLCFNQKHQSTSAVTASFSRAFAIPKPIGHTAEAAQQAKQPPQGAK